MAEFIRLAQREPRLRSHSKINGNQTDASDKAQHTGSTLKAFEVMKKPYEIALTLFLFTKSDFKTTVFPATLMAAAAAPLRTPSHLLHAFFWVWLHILQFDVSNQTINPLEDEVNKKDRPLPAKRITLRNALILRWALVPICWLLSFCYSDQALLASIGLCMLTALHNELSASQHWVGKNGIAACAATAFELGAILVIGDDRTRLSRVAELSLICSVGIFSSTFHAQDFKDVDGDAQVGRKTVPIMYPNLAAPALAITLLGWSAYLITLWQVGLVTATLFGGTAVLTSLAYLYSTTIVQYQWCYYLYNFWMTFAHCLPFFRGVDPVSLTIQY